MFRFSGQKARLLPPIAGNGNSWIRGLSPLGQPGTYALAVSVGSRIGTPEIALPLGDQVGETRRYVLGEVVVVDNEEIHDFVTGTNHVIDDAPPNSFMKTRTPKMPSRAAVRCAART